jgi:3-hydroxyethyl bacteriochlorophyllide a dehydrogenase
MRTTAVILHEARRLQLEAVDLDDPRASDVVVDIAYSGISAGTERLLYTGEMPPFPGMGYPLVPGYESVGTVVEAGAESELRPGQTVFVPGASCFGAVRGLFGGAAQQLVTSATRVVPIDSTLRERGVLIALAATAHHALRAPGATLPDLIIGHGVVGRLLARLTLALGGEPPTVWDHRGERRSGAGFYPVTDAEHDTRKDYRSIYDASGDAALLDTLVGRLSRGGEIVLAGFYHQRPSFAFAPAFMREMRLRIAAEWTRPDLDAVNALIAEGSLSLGGLVTDCWPATMADKAYPKAFDDPRCLKMVLDWSVCA